MRIIWVPQWAVLPVIIEDREMAEETVQGGRLPPGVQPLENSARPRLGESEAHSAPANASGNNAPFEYHLQGATPQQQLPAGQIVNVPGQQTQSHQIGRGQSAGNFSMRNLAGALPEYPGSAPSQISHHEQQRYYTGASSGASAYNNQPFPSQHPLNAGNYPIHASHYAASYQDAAAAAQGYGAMQSNQRSHSGGPSPIQTAYPNAQFFPNQQQQYMYYPGHYGQSSPAAYPAPYDAGSSQGYGQQRDELSTMGGRTFHSGGPSPGTGMPNHYATPGQYLRPNSMPAVSKESSNSSSGSIPSTPRGPPRKPKQSGFALWVGNLPSGTAVSDLKDHFSRDATKDIESVFLISKSNCAFVNYRTEAACAAAMTRFHDSRFQGVRLVCRLRRSSAPTASAGVPTGPAALLPSTASTQRASEAITQNRQISSKVLEDAAAESLRTGEPPAKVTDKYFVLKSLTVEDMELSVRTSTWATQAHNEDALNKAYETAENVYLIFSANKSGEYFGYARMASPINEESSASLDWAPRGDIVVDDPDVPRSIPTPATEFAPRGRIIDDSARGTIFWEADPEDENLAPVIDEDVNDPEETIKASESEEVEDAALSSGAQAFGKPFKIVWLATNRLPFYRTRGLRNPWNANREIKIARDGTELETSVGRRLVQLFQKSPSEQASQLPTGYGSGRP